MTLSATMGDGMMNFRKVEVSLSVPCETNEEIQETFDAIREWVSQQVEGEVAKIHAQNPSMGIVQAPVAPTQQGANLDEEL